MHRFLVIYCFTIMFTHNKKIRLLTQQTGRRQRRVTYFARTRKNLMTQKVNVLY